MKTGKLLLLAVFIIITCAGTAYGKTLEEYIGEAEKSKNSGDFSGAEKIMEQALKEYPENATVYAYLGGYIGMQMGGGSTDMGEALKEIERSFGYMDKAVSLEPENIYARFIRGYMGTQIPPFLGRLEQAVNDFEFIISVHDKSPERVDMQIIIPSCEQLSIGYEYLGEFEKAKEVLAKIIKLAPGTEYAKQAEKKIKRLNTTDRATIKNSLLMMNEIPEIRSLKSAFEKEPENDEIGFRLAKAIGEEATLEYDERTYSDTGFRTLLALESVKIMDAVVALEPDNMTYRLERGAVAVEMPFFVNRLEQGIEDLNMVIESDASGPMKAEALYWLGVAYEKKATTARIEVITDYPETPAAEMVFNDIDPSVKRFDRSGMKTPLVVVDFVLGFRDELAPQTAVWIEDNRGRFVKTLYVSGFSGYAREKQINLSGWAKSSEFADYDGVTGASIDIGHHLYVWDMRDNSGKQVKSGEYTVIVETFFWPSMEKQTVSTTITLGEKDDSKVVREGNYIPYLEVKYIP
ncbi:DUF2271 domain-containing protein [Candidatus Latescibacterota bacterium]